MLGGVLAAVPLIFYAIGIEKDESVQTISGFLNVAIVAIIIFVGIREVREVDGKGYITFGKGFSTGMLISLIGGIISAVFSYLYFTVINPGMVTYIRLKAEADMVAEGRSDSEIEMAASWVEMFTSPGMMAVFAIVGCLFIGVVASLVCAGILKKEDPSAMIS